MTTEDKFLAAVDVINSIPYDGTFEPSDEMMLKLYAYYKQATEGPCDVCKPYVWNFSSRAKWNAWNELGTMPKETAMEGYVEELTKVIETMSYNDKISKFMSLMGPFFEVVSSDEADSQREKNETGEESISASILQSYNPPTILELYHMTKNTEQEPVSQLEAEKGQPPENVHRVYSSSSSVSSSSEMSNFDLLSDLSGVESSPEVEKDLMDVFKTNSSKNCKFLAENDILVLAFLNLQSTLEDILQKLDRLTVLAESTNLRNSMIVDQNLDYDGWSLNFAGTAFALIWPVVVELCFTDFR